MFSRYDSYALMEVIHRYLSDELTAFKPDEALSEIGARTEDETVQQVVALFGYLETRGPGRQNDSVESAR